MKNFTASKAIAGFSGWTLLYNLPLSLYLANHYDGSNIQILLFAGSFFLAIFLLLNIIYSFFFIKFLDRPVLVLFVLLNATALYFMTSYHVMIDKMILLNVMQTDTREVLELLNLSFFLCIFFLGLIPSLALLLKVKIIYAPLKTEILQRLKFIGGNFLGVALIFFAFNKDYTSFLRTHRDVKHFILPINYLDASKIFFSRSMHSGQELEMISKGARLSPFWGKVKEKTIMVLVIGETARAQNFSLNSYNKKTNPYLEKRKNLLSFTQVSSCGTSTAISLPCLFSGQGQEGFQEGAHRENFLDILQKSGINVLWRDNNSGCKGVCARVATETQEAFATVDLCPEGRCFDLAMLNKLKESIDLGPDKIFVVLHQLGSHGPAYYLRYPQQFRHFLPQCETEKLQSCTQNEITNAYDNTILYTDFFLDQTLQLLESYSQANTVFMYVSDHGESLGEKNLYLHGLPYWIAPTEQTRVPLLFWASDNFKKKFGLDYKCLRQKVNGSFSHDHIFHSILGLLKVQSSFYYPQLDLFSSCQV